MRLIISVDAFITVLQGVNICLTKAYFCYEHCFLTLGILMAQKSQSLEPLNLNIYIFQITLNPLCNSLYEALQDIVYIRLPPGINFGISLKCQKSLRWGIFGLLLTHRVKIFKRIKSGTSHITHHTSRITHHTSHITQEFVSFTKYS